MGLEMSDTKNWPVHCLDTQTTVQLMHLVTSTENDDINENLITSRLCSI